MTVKVSVDQELAFEENVVFGGLADLIALLEHVLDLCSPLINENFELLILSRVFPRSTPRRKNHIFEFLLLLALLPEGRDWVII